MTQDITVGLDPTPPEIVVVLDGGPPEVVDAVISEVGLVGPPGPPGPPGPAGVSEVGALNEHINSPTPHPVYDDGPDLLVYYRNAKV